ncbi:unnamed protein product [Protopolystoma xenopodis]|uniref:Secreted protein n=1 Tax=Protopolystoma xenopodis TaxID=117903 RepID=A0A3S5BFR2_9PLAT|nr:unnamed protein product [Protopolystoma xenopodis]
MVFVIAAAAAAAATATSPSPAQLSSAQLSLARISGHFGHILSVPRTRRLGRLPRHQAPPVHSSTRPFVHAPIHFASPYQSSQSPATWRIAFRLTHFFRTPAPVAISASRHASFTLPLCSCSFVCLSALVRTRTHALGQACVFSMSSFSSLSSISISLVSLSLVQLIYRSICQSINCLFKCPGLGLSTRRYEDQDGVWPLVGLVLVVDKSVDRVFATWSDW